MNNDPDLKYILEKLGNKRATPVVALTPDESLYLLGVMETMASVVLRHCNNVMEVWKESPDDDLFDDEWNAYLDACVIEDQEPNPDYEPE